VVDPGGNLFRAPIPAGGAVLNGAGECTGLTATLEWGLVETPIFLTATMQVGRVYDAACQLLGQEDAGIGDEDVIIPVVAECDDSFLNDARRMQVDLDDVATALAAARASVGAGRPPGEGAVGAGTGMSCLGFKGGIGTASRVVDADHTVGVLALTNFGSRERLTIDGVPVGQLLPDRDPDESVPKPAGSTAHHASGEIFFAAATGLRAPRGSVARIAPLVGRDLDDLFAAVVEATEESVLNSLFQARTVTGRSGNTSPALPVDAVAAILRAHGRAAT
jgi:D-aminopeptidase